MIATAPIGLYFIGAFVLTVATMFYLMLRKA
jgi:hypothetical protein